MINSAVARASLKYFFPDGVKLNANIKDDNGLFTISIHSENIQFIIKGSNTWTVTLKQLEDFLNGQDIDS